jgi:hypothetical protein
MKKFSIESASSFSINDVAHYKDTPWTILFICQLLTTLAFAFSFGLKALSSTPPDEVAIEEDGSKDKESFDKLSLQLISGLFLVVGMGCLLSIAWVQVTATMASKIVMFSLVAVILVNVFSGIALFAFDQIIPALLLLIFAAVSLLFFLYVKDRVEFVAANLKVACKAVLAMPAVILWALVVLLLQVSNAAFVVPVLTALCHEQVVWCVFWFIAAYGVATNESVTTITKHGETYDLTSCTSYTYYDVSSKDYNCLPQLMRLCLGC